MRVWLAVVRVTVKPTTALQQFKYHLIGWQKKSSIENTLDLLEFAKYKQSHWCWLTGQDMVGRPPQSCEDISHRPAVDNLWSARILPPLSLSHRHRQTKGSKSLTVLMIASWLKMTATIWLRLRAGWQGNNGESGRQIKTETETPHDLCLSPPGLAFCKYFPESFNEVWLALPSFTDTLILPWTTALFQSFSNL